MNKKFVSVREYLNRRDEISVRLNEIADTLETEKREANDAEKVELQALEREQKVLDLRIAGADKTGMVEVSARELAFDKFLREAITANQNLESKLKRTAGDPIVSTQTGVDGMIPLRVNDIVKPLEEGLILDKVGLPLMMGLQGSYVWPVVGAVEAEIAGEAVALVDKTIDFSKVQPNPQRVGISISITRETIFKTEGIAYEVVKMQLPQAMARALNYCMFHTDATKKGIDGPFFGLANTWDTEQSKYVPATPTVLSTIKTPAQKKSAYYVKFAGATPTYKELLQMKGLLLAKGVDGGKLAYIMDEYTKAELEATPRASGSGLMCIEDGKIAGIPVFTTNYINKGVTSNFVGLGDWSYQPLQNFGEVSFVIDPYTKAGSNAIRLILNANWATDSLRKEAFMLGVCNAE